MPERFFGLVSHRITPAWAGKRKRVSPYRNRTKDHPRMGGEKSLSVSSVWSRTGSPPHGRGKAAEHRPSLGPEGITPAWAGKRRLVSTRSMRSWDHPRMGGEKLETAVRADGRPGSPPHGRGKGDPDRFWWLSVRITPAWAGKRALPELLRMDSRDHPRMGGEKTKKIP